MSIQLKGAIDTLAAFPAGKNVRITIAGIASCEFETDTSKPSLIHFVRHAAFHELRVTVRRKRVDSTTVEVVLPERKIDLNSRNLEIITGNSVRPNAYKPTTLQTGEFDLDTLVNLSELHKTQFNRNNRRSVLLTLNNCEFYIKKLTDDKYYIVVNSLPTTLTPKKLGEVLAAYMKVSGVIGIRIDGDNIFSALIDDQGASYQYEIEFTNHCQSDASDCQLAMGRKGSDIRFLYDILTPTKIELSKITLLKVDLDSATKQIIMTPNVAACLPGGTKPCSTC